MFPDLFIANLLIFADYSKDKEINDTVQKTWRRNFNESHYMQRIQKLYEKSHILDRDFSVVN